MVFLADGSFLFAVNGRLEGAGTWRREGAGLFLKPPEPPAIPAGSSAAPRAREEVRAELLFLSPRTVVFTLEQELRVLSRP